MLRQQELVIKSEKQKEVIDLTDILNDLLRKNLVDTGSCIMFTTHTTCALTTADLDPGTDSDLIDAYTNMVPKLKYRHPHDPAHVGDHIMSSIIGASVFIPVRSSSLVIGAYQRVVLVEFNGPRERKVIVSYIPA
jgi:secondary thiamine-phosphate synthase enzyme